MKIKKFNQINEDSENELKAIENGFNVGDYVYNHKMGRKQQIVKPARTVLDDKEDKYCTLGAIGQWPDNFTKAEEDARNLNKHKFTKYSLELKIKKTIDEILQFGYFSKDDLKEMLEKYINNK
jgi:hypothetical protein